MDQRKKISHTPTSRCEINFKVRNPFLRCEFPKIQFRTPLWKVRKFSHGAKSSPSTRVRISHTSSAFSHGAKQCAKISHTTVQGAKISHTQFQGAKSSIEGVPFSHTQFQGAKFADQGAKISHGKILSSKNLKRTFKLKFYPRNCA